MQRQWNLRKLLLPAILTVLPVPTMAADPDHDHFVGVYAYRATPYWPAFEITRNGDAFILGIPGDPEWELNLRPSDDGLLGKDDEGENITLRRNPSEQVYTLAKITQMSTWEGVKGLAEQCILVKRLPNPGGTLEAEYGVRAADLVRHVRQSEQWIHQAKSFQLVASDNWVKTPRGIEARERELRAQFPEADLSNKAYWNLLPEENGRLEFAFDQRRFRSAHWVRGNFDRIETWDGQQFVLYEKYYTHEQEGYLIDLKLDGRGDSLVSSLSWLRSGRHDFWWKEPTPNEFSYDDWYGRPEEFILTGKQDYRGPPCYVLECCPKACRRVRRWFVGAADGLLYGNLTYEEGQLTWEHWTLDYRQLRPGWWFPMTQGYHVLERMAMVGGDDMKPFVASQRNITVEKVTLDEDLPDAWFDIQFKEGIRVVDNRFGALVAYKYKSNMTDEEWEQIRVKAQQRADRDAAEQKALDARIGQPAKDLPTECRWLNSEPLTWQNLRGKTVILQFWAHSCGPCRNHIRMMSSREPDDAVVVIGIHTPEDDMKAIREVLSNYNADGPICVDVPPERSGDGFGAISAWFGVKRIPYWCVVGPDGRVAGHGAELHEIMQLTRKAGAAQ